MTSKNIRRNFGKVEKNVPELDLTLVQKESWERFLKEGIAQELADISPIDDFTGKNWRVILGEPTLGLPKLSSSTCQDKGLTYSAPLKIVATLINKRTGKEVTQDVFLGDLPQMTERGTFVINGIERSVINQIVRSPGVYFSGNLDITTGRMLYTAEVRPLRGSWLEFEVSKNDVIAARIDRRRKVVGTAFLRAMGLSTDEEILNTFKEENSNPHHDYLKSTFAKDTSKNKEEAFLEIYRKLRPGEPVLLENAENLFTSLFLDPKRYDLGSVGRYKINKRLGLKVANVKENQIITRVDIVGVLKYLI